MNFKFTPEHDQAKKPQKSGPWLMKSSQSNFNLRLPGSYLARSYLTNCYCKTTIERYAASYLKK